MTESREREGVVDTAARMAAQCAQILSADNRYYTIQALRAQGIDRDPTPAELAWHYIRNGGAEHFHEETRGQFVKS